MKLSRESVEELKKEFNRRIEELMSLVDTEEAKEIDWSDPKWIGRLVEVRDEYEEWCGPVAFRSYEPSLSHPYRTDFSGWVECRPYTGPTRPNWIEHDGGECPVNREQVVNVQYRDGRPDGGRAARFLWVHDHSVKTDIMRYSVVVP